jgi:pimeloyl-ACP methyl ester carboxylesterase
MEKLTGAGYAPVNGLNMYYEIYGEGSMPLVLIHGGGSTIQSTFSNLIPLLSMHHKLVAVELQAHGRTSDRDSPESFEQDADDVVALLGYLKINKADFLGFSNGGTTTLQIAVRHALIVNKIIVVSASYKGKGMVPGFFDGIKLATLDDMPESLKAAFLKVNPDQERLQVMFEKDRSRMEHFRDMSDEDLVSIKVPTLLMVADHDVVTAGHVLEMSQLIAGAQLVVLPGTHGSFIGEVGMVKKGSRLPEISVALIEEFLND